LPESTDESGEGGRVDKRGLGMTMEHLAEIYARKGQYDVAGQLLLQAVSTLLPPQSQQAPPVRDRCQGEWGGSLSPSPSNRRAGPRTQHKDSSSLTPDSDVTRRAARTQLISNSRYGKLRTGALQSSYRTTPRFPPQPTPTPAPTQPSTHPVVFSVHPLTLTSSSSS
jgi:hypothetical protein